MARKQEDPVRLSDAERAELEAIVSKGRHKARVIRRAQTVLWSDAGKPDSEIAQLHGVTPHITMMSCLSTRSGTSSSARC